MVLGMKTVWLVLGMVFVAGKSEVSKVEQLKEMQGEEDFVELTVDTFTKFVQNQSRNYIVVVYFSTFLYESHCPGCQVMNPVFRKIAYSYKVSNGNEAIEKDQEKLKPVFFVILEYSQDTNLIFQKFQFQNIPNLFVSTKSFLEEGHFFNIDRSKLLEHQDDKVHTPESVLNFINSKTGRHIELQVSFTEFIQTYGLFSSITLSSILLLYSIIKYYKKPQLWWVASLLINIVCIGGVIYNILHEVQYGEYNPETKSFSFISEGSRDQFFFEGFAMAALFMLTSTSLVCINLAADIDGRWFIRLVSLISIAVCVISIYYPTTIYQQKATWYTPSFNPPDDYIKGSLLHDQGNSF